ncbi:MAG: MBOAT family protein [Alphaproteobacteria bacterium]|nr:MBOAT family protein [Alphaproteobacteria bacterium]
MLFNSFQFLFLFFPVSIAVFRGLGSLGARAQQLGLVGISLFFYASWEARFLLLLIGSILINYLIGLVIWRCIQQEREGVASLFLAVGVTANLLVIGFYKYAGFFFNNLNDLTGTNILISSFILPLGISFFTFEQISFLVDIHHKEIRPADLIRYALFVSFFPRVVAGPILRFAEISPQLANVTRTVLAGEDLMVGVTIFVIGLVKKTVLADGIAPYGTSVFYSASNGIPVDFFTAWSGVLAYTFQLYFDFSGYSDMAIGAARCFGIRFPMNFYSPYQATSIIDFWRRWHITLSRFLRDYLYISLGGNRRGASRRHVNLIVTMLLGGLWHGANWTFVFWGGLHGVYLIINHAWLAVSGRSATIAKLRRSQAGAGLGWVLTFLAVVVAWVFFRSSSLGVAFTILKGMIGQNGVTVPAGLGFALEPVRGFIAMLGISFSDESGSAFVRSYSWIAVLFAIASLAPNTQQLMRRYNPVLDLPELARLERDNERGPIGCLTWAPARAWAITVGTLAFLGTVSITRISEFFIGSFDRRQCVRSVISCGSRPQF